MIPTLVIAEPGSTHEGNLDTMFRLIDAAAAAGCDAIKHQWLSSADRLVERRRAPQFRASYGLLAYPLAWLPRLAAYAETKRLETFCTVYLPEDAATVAPFVSRIKVASFEAQAVDVREAVLATGVPTIVSLGMADKAAARTVASWADLILACTSAYPCPPEAAHLATIRWLADLGGKPVGYSDHTANTLTGGFAVAAGAVAVEVHIRLDDTRPANLDYATALPPAALATYVQRIRLAEMMRGEPVKRVQAAEAAMAALRVTG